MSPLEPALDLFVAHVRVEKGLAENSVEAYLRDLRRYVEHLDVLGAGLLGAGGPGGDPGAPR